MQLKSVCTLVGYMEIGPHLPFGGNLEEGLWGPSKLPALTGEAVLAAGVTPLASATAPSALNCPARCAVSATGEANGITAKNGNDLRAPVKSRGEELGSASIPSGGALRCSNVCFEQLCNRPEAELEALGEFPSDVESYLRQSPPTLPLSSDGEMNTAHHLRSLVGRSEARVRRECGWEWPLHLKVALVRGDITSPDGTVWRGQPLHIVTMFEFMGKRVIGPVFGSIANPVLRLHGELPYEKKKELIVPLVSEVCSAEHCDIAVISFPRGVYQLACPTGQGPPRISTAANILTSEPLGFSAHEIDHTAHSSEGLHRFSTWYFWRAVGEVPQQDTLVRILRIIREERLHQLLELRTAEGFHDQEAAVRDPFRREATRRLFGIDAE